MKTKFCFGSRDWPRADELVASGHALIHGARTEPWGQTVARLQSPEGPIIGISYTPWMHG